MTSAAAESCAIFHRWLNRYFTDLFNCRFGGRCLSEAAHPRSLDSNWAGDLDWSLSRIALHRKGCAPITPDATDVMVSSGGKMTR